MTAMLDKGTENIAALFPPTNTVKKEMKDKIQRAVCLEATNTKYKTHFRS